MMTNLNQDDSSKSPAENTSSSTPKTFGAFSLESTGEACTGSCNRHRPLRILSAAIIAGLLGLYATLQFSPEIAAAIPDVLLGKPGQLANSGGRQGCCHKENHCTASCHQSEAATTEYVCPHSSGAAESCQHTSANNPAQEMITLPPAITVGEIATFIGKTGCAACEFDVHPLQNRDELGLGLLLEDGRIVVVEQAHTLYEAIYEDRFSRRLVKVTGKVLQHQDHNIWIEPSELILVAPNDAVELPAATADDSTTSASTTSASTTSSAQ